jgi:competence protein ComEA
VPTLSRSEIAAYALCAVVVALLGMRALRAGPSAPEAGAAPSAAGAPSRTSPVGERADPGVPALVHVVGAVRRPGVYELHAGARVEDAVRRAGGATVRADLTGLNLAAKAADGQQVVVPARAPPGARAAAGPTGVQGPISLSSATLEQLDTLDGVGPATAQKILDVRTEKGGFASVDELADVPGIGPKRLEALRERVAP